MRYFLQIIGLGTLLAVAMCCALISSRITNQLTPGGHKKTQIGLASYYGGKFSGRKTASGEIFDPMQFTAAHRSLPFGTILSIRNPKNGKSIFVRINDRGPFFGDRALDLSEGSARFLSLLKDGVAEVEYSVISSS